jgi:hypothetical protein
MYDLKTFSSQNLNMGIKKMKNFTLISKLLRKMRKFCYQKSYRQKKCAKLEFVLSILITFKSF